MLLPNASRSDVQAVARRKLIGGISGYLFYDAVEVPDGVKAALLGHLRHGQAFIRFYQIQCPFRAHNVQISGKAQPGLLLEISGKIGL